MKTIARKLFILASGFWLLASAYADLSVTVAPGYTFGADEVPTIDNLNLLGLPTISVYGTIDGSNGVAPNSLTGDQLVNGFPDGTTIEFNGGSPRSIRVKAGGIGTNELNPAAFLAPLVGGSNTLVQLQTNSLTLTYLKTNWADGTGISTSVSTNAFILLATSSTNSVVTNTVVTGITLTNLATAVASVTAASMPAVGAMCKFLGPASGTNVLDGTNVFRSVNVSNVVRNSAGNYTLNFSNSFLNTNYVVNLTYRSDFTFQGGFYVGVISQRTNSMTFNAYWVGVGMDDASEYHVTIFP